MHLFGKCSGKTERDNVRDIVLLHSYEEKKNSRDMCVTHLRNSQRLRTQTNLRALFLHRPAQFIKAGKLRKKWGSLRKLSPISLKPWL